MKKISLILLMSLGMGSAAFAQTAAGGVTMSTDPAKAAAVERHAQELKAHPTPEVQAKPATKTASTHTSTHKTAHHTTKQHTTTKSPKKPVAKM